MFAFRSGDPLLYVGTPLCTRARLCKEPPYGLVTLDPLIGTSDQWVLSAPLGALLRFRAQYRAQKSWVSFGQSPRRVRCPLYTKAHTIQFDNSLPASEHARRMLCTLPAKRVHAHQGHQGMPPIRGQNVHMAERLARMRPRLVRLFSVSFARSSFCSFYVPPSGETKMRDARVPHNDSGCILVNLAIMAMKRRRCQQVVFLLLVAFSCFRLRFGSNGGAGVEIRATAACTDAHRTGDQLLEANASAWTWELHVFPYLSLGSVSAPRRIVKCPRHSR